MSVALDLPKNHPLRATIEQFKKRFEESNDESRDFKNVFDMDLSILSMFKIHFQVVVPFSVYDLSSP